MGIEVVEVDGHIIDSLILAKILDVIVDAGAQYRLLDVEIGRTAIDASHARIELTGDDSTLEALLVELQAHGANRTHMNDASLEPASLDGVFPAGFYSTTNLPTSIRVDGSWIDVANPEMDCAVVVDTSDGSARTAPMHKVKAQDLVVVGHEGVRVTAPDRPRGASPFQFMTSEVSSEKPKALLVADVASRVRSAHDAGGKILVVCGPAVIHTGAGPHIARLVREGWIDVLFSGNGFATHDLESNVLGTSLGVPLAGGPSGDGGHANHLRVINEIRRHGSIAAAVDSGYVAGGVMYECVKRSVPFVLAGSPRDDGPLPDVQTDVVVAADAMRGLLPGVTVALMFASTLHAIATGNLLPAGVQTFCVDINQAVVTKLADRGSHQTLGIVTDVGLFIEELAFALCGRPASG